MVAEVCSRFGGYPSDYIKNHTLGQLHYDHKLFVKLTEGEINAATSALKPVNGRVTPKLKKIN